MADGAASQQHLTAEQYRERAKLVRHAAQGVKSALLRHDLLDITAQQYEHLAETVERWRSRRRRVKQGCSPARSDGGSANDQASSRSRTL
jgi:galactokinase